MGTFKVQRLFGKKDKKDDNKELAGALVGAGAAGGGLYATGLNSSLRDKLNENVDKHSLIDKNLFNKLKKSNKDVVIYTYNKGGNSFYLQEEDIRKVLATAKGTKYEKKFLDDYNKGLSEHLKGKFKEDIDHAIKPKIFLANNHQNSADVLAHELGHQKGANKFDQLIGRKLNIAEHHGKATSLGTGALGFTAGYKREKDKKNGVADKHDKYHAAILGGSAALALPALICEGGASRRAMKMLKEAGATKEQLKNAKKSLSNAYLSHATYDIRPALSSELGYQSGRVAGKLSD